MTVELKEFVEKSLKDVLKAVHDAGEDPQIGKQVRLGALVVPNFPKQAVRSPSTTVR